MTPPCFVVCFDFRDPLIIFDRDCMLTMPRGCFSQHRVPNLDNFTSQSLVYNTAKILTMSLPLVAQHRRKLLKAPLALQQLNPPYCLHYLPYFRPATCHLHSTHRTTFKGVFSLETLPILGSTRLTRLTRLYES
jgi:hypothetical protein